MFRRKALKVLGAAAITASGAMSLGLRMAAAADLRYAPEPGAALKVLRWKRIVQGDEDVWIANTRRFTEQTGVAVQVESINGEDLRPKGAMAANVDGPGFHAMRCQGCRQRVDGGSAGAGRAVNHDGRAPRSGR